MSMGARCGSCTRQLLLGSWSSQRRLRCPFCGFGFAPAYAPSPLAWPPGPWPRRPPWHRPRRTRVDDWQRLRLTGPRSSTQSPTPCPRSRPNNPVWPAGAIPTGGPAMLPPIPPKLSRTDDRQHEISRLPMLAEGSPCRRRSTCRAPLLRPACIRSLLSFAPGRLGTVYARAVCTAATQSSSADRHRGS